MKLIWEDIQICWIKAVILKMSILWPSDMCLCVFSLFFVRTCLGRVWQYLCVLDVSVIIPLSTVARVVAFDGPWQLGYGSGSVQKVTVSNPNRHLLICQPLWDD